ncbi:MAG: hypothetical protein ACNA7Y_02740, partial [Gammaproteobacteria bacterium]
MNMQSIHRFLFISSLAVITIATILTAISYYYLHHLESYHPVDAVLYYVFLGIYVLSALLTWLIIGYALNSLKRIAKEIAY